MWRSLIWATSILGFLIVSATLMLLMLRWHPVFCCAGIQFLLRWHPRYVFAAHALPLCGAAPTFLCRLQRKVGKRKQLTPSRLTENREGLGPHVRQTVCSLSRHPHLTSGVLRSGRACGATAQK